MNLCYYLVMENKKLSIFETGIIGLFVGVILASYQAYINYSDIAFGKILGYTSLYYPLSSLNILDTQNIYSIFAITTLVFFIYGMIFGLLIKLGFKWYYLTILALALLAMLVFEQQTIPEIKNQIDPLQNTASIIRHSKSKEKYFGMEAYGDLNNDNRDDIAFIIERNDDNRGSVYYLTSALTEDTGKNGTNLVYLGNNVKPISISIENNAIKIDYNRNSTSTQTMEAVIQNNKLIISTSTNNQ